MALSSRLPSSTCRLADSARTLAAAALPSASPRSTPWAWALAARSASCCATSGARSTTGAGLLRAPCCASSRASSNSWSTSWAARSMPAASRCWARWRAASSGARCRPCSCSFSACNGERRAWAASATKCCWLANACCTRANSRFSSCTSGCTSCGKPASATGASDAALRPASSRRTRSTGRSAWPTTHHTASASKGASSAIGHTVRQASVRAIWRRTCRFCATWITWAGDCSENTR